MYLYFPYRIISQYTTNKLHHNNLSVKGIYSIHTRGCLTGETTSVCQRQRELKINWNKKMHLCTSSCILDVRFVDIQTSLYILIFTDIIIKRGIANKLPLFVTYTIQHCKMVEAIAVRSSVCQIWPNPVLTLLWFLFTSHKSFAFY